MSTQPEIIAALIAAIVSLAGSIVTLIIAMKSLRNERDKLSIDRENLRKELKSTAEQTSVWKAEVVKLKVETDKIIEETRAIRNQRISAEREELKNMLILFERAVFHAPLNSEDPVNMFKAIRQTRVSLQMSGGSSILNKEAAFHFSKTRDILMESESKVMERFPELVRFVDEVGDLMVSSKQKDLLYSRMGGGKWESVNLMADIRQNLNHHISEAKKQLDVLDVALQSSSSYK